VQAVAVAAAGHEAAGELVHDDDLALFDDVVHVALEQGVGLEGLVDVVQQLDVGRVVEVFGLEQLSAWATPSSVRATLGPFRRWCSPPRP
jgi:hypothetical protein